MAACIVSNCRQRKAIDAAAIGADQEVGPVCLTCAAEIEEHPERFRIRVDSTASGHRIWIDRVLDGEASQRVRSRCGACGGTFVGNEWKLRHTHGTRDVHASCCTDDRHAR